jgi:heme exporter protein C
VRAPADYEQGESYRIIYVHVPAAWMSMFVYMVMAVSSAVFLIWRMKLADVVAAASAPIGASFTLIALITGAFWGKPMWGAWWVWDARLTSELVLLFLYLGYIALRGAIEQPQTAARAAAILALVGVVNIPIIHFSVEWWNTLHQPATITRMDKPAMHISMLRPLLLMVAGFQLLYFYNLMVRLQTGILQRESRTNWVAELAAQNRV